MCPSLFFLWLCGTAAVFEPWAELECYAVVEWCCVDVCCDSEACDLRRPCEWLARMSKDFDELDCSLESWGMSLLRFLVIPD